MSTGSGVFHESTPIPIPLPPPTLLSPEPRAFEDAAESRFCSWQRIVYPVISSGICITAIVLKALDVQGIGSNPVWGTFLAFGAGAAAQNAIQTGLDRRVANQGKSFIGDYITAIFLITTQVYANIAPSPLTREGVLSSLVALGGAASSAMVHSLLTRKLTEGKEVEPLYASGDYLKGMLFSSHAKRISWAVCKGLVGIGAIVTGAKVTQLSLLRDFGAILVGDGLGQLGSALWHRRIENKRSLTMSAVENGTGSMPASEPKEARTFQKVAKIVLPIIHVLPAPLIIAAGTLGKKHYVTAAGVHYGLVGLSTGIKRQMERIRFFTSPIAKLSELKHLKPDLNRLEKVFRVFKWAVAAAVVVYAGLGIAGFDFQTERDDQFSDVDVTALSTFIFFLFGSYAVSEIAKKDFNRRLNILSMDKEKNIPFRNEFYFHTVYSLGPPIVALYLLEKMRIGDIALQNYKILADVLSAVAYASLATGIGQEASARGEYAHPRIFSALPAALVGKFIMRKIAGEV